MTKKKIGLFAVVSLVVLIAISGKRTNPPIERTVDWDSPETKATFYRACADCHSHETKWPWYSHVAPVSWKVIHNINEGREEFNISATDLGEADEAGEKVLEGEMPPTEYVRFHSEAKLTPEEKDTFVVGLISTFGAEEDHDE